MMKRKCYLTVGLLTEVNEILLAQDLKNARLGGTGKLLWRYGSYSERVRVKFFELHVFLNIVTSVHCYKVFTVSTL